MSRVMRVQGPPGARFPKYADQAFGLTDAAMMAMALRLGAPIATLDRRRFSLFRDERDQPLTLVP